MLTSQLRFAIASLVAAGAFAVAAPASAQTAEPPTTDAAKPAAAPADAAPTDAAKPGDAGATAGSKPAEPGAGATEAGATDAGATEAGAPADATKARNKTAQDAKESVDRDDPDLRPIEDDDEPKKSQTEWFLGARFRDFIVPRFMFSIFADGGPASAVNVFSGGPELTMHQKNLEMNFSVTVPYGDYSMDPFLFKSKSDEDRAFEEVSSTLKLLTVSVDILGNIPLDKNGMVSFLIGGGVGLSGVWGDLNRNQVYPNDPNDVDPDDLSKWSRCDAPGDPNGVIGDQNFCDDSNDHYGNYSEASWANGGSKPFLFPYLALPHIAFRVAPIPELQLRVDTGFSVTGFFFGFGAGGKLPI